MLDVATAPIKPGTTPCLLLGRQTTNTRGHGSKIKHQQQSRTPGLPLIISRWGGCSRCPRRPPMPLPPSDNGLRTRLDHRPSCPTVCSRPQAASCRGLDLRRHQYYAARPVWVCLSTSASAVTTWSYSEKGVGIAKVAIETSVDTVVMVDCIHAITKVPSCFSSSTSPFVPIRGAHGLARSNAGAS